MEEEISVKEIIETFWKGKTVIIGITLVLMVISGVASFFIIPPTYEASSMIRIQNNVSVEGTEEKSSLNSIVEVINTDVSIKKLIEKLKLDQESYTIETVRNMMHVELISGTSVVKISVTGVDSKLITGIANVAAFELGAKTEISDRSTKVVELQNRQILLADQLTIRQEELEEAQRQIANTPEKLITRKALADDPYLQSVAEDQSVTSNKAIGALELVSEEINPLYTELKTRIAETSISMKILSKEKSVNEETINNHLAVIGSLEESIHNEILGSQGTVRMLNGFQAVSVSPAIEPVEPIGPDKFVNIAIAAVLGLIIGTVVVFGRAYWRSINSKSRTLNTTGLSG
ncbi:Wzz/FepE/Etk N-terminal domain-containing protein [Paenibacillus sp. TRM 82003]|nr:Wzz/FepE/Etk N-terminal domain-containing protein [Paenibacillus sp. TRM 82003]